MLFKKNKEGKLKVEKRTTTALKYAPAVFVVIAVILQWNLFVTPADLEKKHRDIITEAAQTYVTKEEYKNQKEEFKEMKTKIDRIYDFLIRDNKRIN